MNGKKFIAIISIVCILAVILCIPAFATVTESDGDGYALYNGVKLPDINYVWTDDLKAQYPYAYLVNYTQGSMFYLYLVSEPLFIQYLSQYSSDFLFGSSSYTYTHYAIPYISSVSSSGSWNLIEANRINGGSLNNVKINPLFWSSVDVFNTDSNSIYLAASNPISLDGYNIIEWDGDVTGFSSSDTWYSLSNYKDASTGIAVYFDDSKLSVGNNFVTMGSGWSISYSVDNSTSLPIARGVPTSGVSAVRIDNSHYTSLIAYRPIESPPGEGGDTPDEPQPPFGATEKYLRLHPFLLTPQQK